MPARELDNSNFKGYRCFALKIEMFKKVDVKLLGLVQNMSSFKCGNCGHVEHVFGENGAIRMAQEIGCDILGDLPLVTDIRRGADCGEPVCLDNVERSAAGVIDSHDAVLVYKEICAKIMKDLGISGN